MLTGRRYRLELTAGQAQFAQRIGDVCRDVCRDVWNTGLEQQQTYRQRGAWINYHEQARQLAEAKAEHLWLKEAPSHCLQQTLMDLDKACKMHGAFKVGWRSARRWPASFRFPDPKQITVRRLGRKTGRVKLPKLGWVRFRWSRPLDGVVRSATVSFDGGHWYVSFLVEDGKNTPGQHVSCSSVGIDRGVNVAVATSDGDLFDRDFLTPGERQRYRRLQQQLARQRKRSNNRKKTLHHMRLIRGRERRRRKDFHTQIAAHLTHSHGLVVLEDLKTRNMTGSAKGTIEEPGRNIAQKAGLNRNILDKGWYGLELALAGAARYTGTRIVKVPAAYTSQTCYPCGHVAPENRESQAVFRCVACGHTDHADSNASKIVNAAGRKQAEWPEAVSARGDLAVGQSAKREPTGNRKELPFHLLNWQAGIPRL